MSTHIPIFLASDDNYAPFVAVTIASICYTTQSYVDFYVLNDGITPLHQKQIASLKNNFSNFSLRFISLDAGKHFSDFPDCNGLTKTSYSRLLIPELVGQLGKVIYSDVDVIATGDIAELYTQDLGPYVIGAVDHACFAQDKKLLDHLQNKLALDSGHKYFYTGNLLLDCSRWRDQNTTAQLFALAREYTSRLTFGDQCILNKFFDYNTYKRLDYRFCLTTQDYFFFKNTDEGEFSRLVNTAIVRHFETSRKPWVTDIYSDGNSIPNFEDFWFFAEMTPFFAGLQQRFVASVLKETASTRVGAAAGGISAQNSKAAILTQLRKRMAARR
jgi:lipopolysaccharide biosynthesis glycosyltransferase